MILFAWHLMLISNLLIRNCYNRYGCNPSVEDSGGVEWSCSEQLSPLCPAAVQLIRAISRHAVYHWIIKPISQLWGSWILTLILSGKSAFAFKTANSLPKRPSTFTNLINLLLHLDDWQRSSLTLYHIIWRRLRKSHLPVICLSYCEYCCPSWTTQSALAWWGKGKVGPLWMFGLIK